MFYINLPDQRMTFVGMTMFLKEISAERHGKELDWFGFGTLSLGIAAFQVMLDRGEQLDWFSSREIVTEAVVAATAFYLFLVHTFTARDPFG